MTETGPAIESVSLPHRSMGAASGFRHFLGTPASAQRFKVHGVDPLGSRESTGRLRQLMSGLAARMAMEFPWPRSNDPAVRNWENPLIPSGYTYLLQLVAHDLVQTSIPVSAVQSPINGVANGRAQGLRLDTIYGGGPLSCPFAYALDGASGEVRTKLRLGRIQKDKQDASLPCPFRDIGRATAENLGEIGDGALTEVMIADSRNDDHPIIAQLTALFHHLHNGIVDLLRPARPLDSPSDRQAAYSRFLCARTAVTLIYRQIIRKDVMKRVLHPAIYDAYCAEAPRLLDAAARPRPRRAGAVAGEAEHSLDTAVPLEFTHGVFRFGHAMVRNEYRFNDLAEFDLVTTLDRTSSREPGNMPLDKNWIVQWSHFFAIDGSRPNLSRRIGPELSPGLLYESRFTAIDETRRVGLLYRDLMSGAYAGLWSVNALIREIEAVRPEFVALSPLLRDLDHRSAQLRDWLEHRRELTGLTKDDVQSLSSEPPLLLFTLLEAALDPQARGARLGVLGSILVAEVIFGALVRSPLPEEENCRSIKAMLSRLCTSIYGEDRLAALPEIQTMAELVEATAGLAGLRAAKPAFV